MGAAPLPGRTPSPSDVTDKEWALLPPSVPHAQPGGRPEEHPTREILQGICDVVRSGCAWRMLPPDLPPWQTVYHSCRVWRQDGTWEVMPDLRRGDVRVAEGRHRQPSAGSIESPSVQTTANGGSTGTRRTHTSPAARGIAASIREGYGC